MKKLLGCLLCVTLVCFFAAPAMASTYPADEFLDSTTLPPGGKSDADEAVWLAGIVGPLGDKIGSTIDFGSGPKVLEDYDPGFGWIYAIVKVGEGQTGKAGQDWLFGYRDNPDDNILTIGTAGSGNTYPFLNGISHIQFFGPQSVPEPATMLLLGSGIFGLALFGRRKFKK